MKRLFDLVVSLVIGLLSLPLIVVIAFVIRLYLGAPVIFIQPRIGLRGKTFNLYKFRTMKEEIDSMGELLEDSERLTKLGKFLRATSIDELPTLWNVIVGNMSVVGPRPLLCEYLSLYSVRQARRHEVKPGITGWAQINGRNNIEWKNKLELDVWYVENQSFILDLKIILATVFKVVNQEGVNKDGVATTVKFKGNKED